MAFPRFSLPGCLSHVALLALLLTSCTTPPATSRNAQATVHAPQYDPALQQARQVLKDAGFILDRDDHRFGVITSHPLIAATAFEPWRGENTPANLGPAATLGQLRRTARFTLTPTTTTNPADTQGPTTFTPRVEVLVERRQQPLRRIDGSAQRVFTQLSDIPPEWKQRGIESSYWEPFQRDAALERVLLDRWTYALTTSRP